MSPPEDQNPKASGSRQPYNPLSFPAITPRAITQRLQLEAAHSESELEPDSAMEDILSRVVQSYEPQYPALDYSPDPFTMPVGLLQRFGQSRTRQRGAPSTTSSRHRVDTREYRQSNRGLSQKQYDCLLATIINDAKEEFEKQPSEITKLTDALLAQAKTITDQQAVHRIINDGAKATYEELTTLRQQVNNQIAALKGQAEGQQEEVATLTYQIKATLVIRWETLIKKLEEENVKVIGAAQAEFDQIKADLRSLNEWSQQAVKQEQEDRSKSCENNKESIEALDQTTATLRRKTKDLESPTKQKRGISVDIDAEIRRHRSQPPLRQGRGIGRIIPPPPPPPPPPPQDGPVTQVTRVAPAPPVKKEPRNIPHPPKFDGTSSKLEEFVQNVDNIFERIPLSYSTTSEKILYVSHLLTRQADVWYRVKQHKQLPNELTKWLEWDSYRRFKNEFMEAHQNHHEQREAKQTMFKDYQRKVEQMVDYISSNRADQLIACLSREGLWEHLVNSIQPEVRTHMVRTSIDKDVLDKVFASIEMCFPTIANAGST